MSNATPRKGLRSQRLHLFREDETAQLRAAGEGANAHTFDALRQRDAPVSRAVPESSARHGADAGGKDELKGRSLTAVTDAVDDHKALFVREGAAAVKEAAADLRDFLRHLRFAQRGTGGEGLLAQP